MGNQVAQDVAGADGRKLVVIADQHQPRALEIDPRQQRCHQRHIDHRHFVDNDGVVRWVGFHVGVVAEVERLRHARPAEFLTVIAQQAVNGPRLEVETLGAQRLLDPFGGLARR